MSTSNEIVAARFKSEDISLENWSFKTFFITPHVRAWTLLTHLFITLSGLPTYHALNDLADLPRFLNFDFLIRQLLSDINSGALSTLFDCMINWPEEEELIWTATYNFFSQKILINIKSTSLSIANSVIVDLYNVWHYPYLIDFLEAL